MNENIIGAVLVGIISGLFSGGVSAYVAVKELKIEIKELKGLVDKLWEMVIQLNKSRV